MIRSVKDLKGFAVYSQDGKAGSIKDFLFDEDRWVIRNMVVDTGAWLPGRRVLISPYAAKSVDWKQGRIDLSLSTKDIETSPPVDTTRPVSREYEIQYHRYYGYPYYWVGTGLWGVNPTPVSLGDPEDFSPGEKDIETPGTDTELDEIEKRENEAADPETGTPETHLRSANAVIGYGLEATDGPVGHVGDLLISDNDWAIHAVVVDTSHWPGGELLSVSPYRVSRFGWDEGKVYLEMTQEEVLDSPEFRHSAARR